MRNELIAAGLLFPLLCGAQEVVTPDGMVNRMLSSIGGRSAWSEVSNTVNKSQQNRLGEPTVVTAVITMDFTRPRFRIETTAPGLHLIRVIDGQNSWRLNRQGEIENVPPDLIQSDMQWYAGHVYRTIQRVAARDRALRLTISDQGRLEVHEGADRIAWFALDARGEPYAFGAHGDEVGSITGPWDFVGDGIHHPSWVARPDGAWRARVEALAVNTRLEEATFARPGAVPLAKINARHTDARGGAAVLDAIGNVRTRVVITEPTFSVVGDYRSSANGGMRIDIIAGDEPTWAARQYSIPAERLSIIW